MEQAQAVGDMTAALADDASDVFMSVTELTHEPVITLGCVERCQVLALEVFGSVVKKSLNQLTHTRPADFFTCSTPAKAWLRVQPKGDGSQQDH